MKLLVLNVVTLVFFIAATVFYLVRHEWLHTALWLVAALLMAATGIENYKRWKRLSD
ncbi:MAG: hypothetical protein Q7R83_03550 [bacterium]|nr:hypothetical protein [bacterium]